MKIEMFHLCPYRDLPEDFREKHRSVWVDVPSQLFDGEIASRTYNETLDEIKYAAEMGYDGVCVNEHHQNAYGIMPSPNIMAAAMSRETKDVAIIVMGNSIALYDPPIRVAEEFAMLDCISGGRLVAGFPVGSAMDTAFGYGSNPVNLREKYAEAEELILRAWESDEIFAFDGKYTQLRYVNLWPRPLQKPRPPIWVPGAGSIETWVNVEHLVEKIFSVRSIFILEFLFTVSDADKLQKSCMIWIVNSSRVGNIPETLHHLLSAFIATV